MTEPANPSRVGRYEIRAELGRGGMATVYRGFDPQVKREIAVKVLPREFLHDPGFRVRFEREAQTIATLEHPAIVPLYDFGEDAIAGQPYIIMRLMPGGSLADRLIKGPLPTTEAARIIAHLAPALDYAHRKGIVHRDLKPANILFDQNGAPYISDFGIAKLSSGGGTQGMTGSGIVGTPGYMSPEQARGEKEIDGRSDIYALGIIVFEMLTGKLPYEAATPMGVIVKHITDPVPSILKARPDLPPACEQIISQAMAKNPDDRFATANDLAETLGWAARGEQLSAQTLAGKTFRARKPQIAQPAPPSKPRRTPAWAWLAAGVIVIGLIAALALGGGAAFSRLTQATATVNSVALASTQSVQTTTTAEFVIVVTKEAEAKATAGAQATGAAEAAATESAAGETATGVAASTQSSLNSTATAEAQINADIAATATAEAEAAAQAQATLSALLDAPKIAFFKNDDIWVVNLDGANLTQLTDGGGQKDNLRWLPDGRTVTYTSGLCVKSIDFMTLEEKSLGCFNSSELLEGFEVSPDSKRFAVSVDGILFVGDYDPDRLAAVGSRGELAELATCFTYSRNRTKSVRWSRNSQQLAVEVVIPFNNISAEVIRLFNTQCGQANLSHLDEFPGTRFSYSSYSRNPQLQNYGWDGVELFAFVDSIRNDGYGDILIYNNTTASVGAIAVKATGKTL
ncbi:MAG: serine/threonine-protein kinase [Chloroflexi bacterium]|nr:serine/threonine-protein kinase [Chloroflexota bacterium]